MMRARNVLFFGFFVCYVGMWDIWVPLNTSSDFCGVLKCGWEVLAESYHEEGKSCGTKRGVRLR